MDEGGADICSEMSAIRSSCHAKLLFCQKLFCVLGLFFFQPTEQNCQIGTLHVSAATRSSAFFFCLFFLPTARSVSALVSHGNACS